MFFLSLQQLSGGYNSRPYSSLAGVGPGAYVDPLLASAADPLGMDASRSYLGGHHSAAAGLIGGVGTSTAAAGLDGITAGLRDTAINSLDLSAAGVSGIAGVPGVGVGVGGATSVAGTDYDRNRYLASRRFVVGKPGSRGKVGEKTKNSREKSPNFGLAKGDNSALLLLLFN